MTHYLKTHVSNLILSGVQFKFRGKFLQAALFFYRFYGYLGLERWTEFSSFFFIFDRVNLQLNYLS